MRNIIDQDDVTFRIASSPRSEAGHRLSRLAIDNDVLSLGLLVQRVGLLNENSIRLAEYEELRLCRRSIVDELGLGLHQRMHSLHGKAVDVDTIKEELLWQMKCIMVFRFDFPRAVCLLEQLAMFGDQISKLASCSFRATARELDPLELRSDSVQGFERLNLVIVPIL